MSALSHHVIESLSVSSGIHFRDATFDFDDRLNCIIGGRGAGKSGVLLLIRFALGAPIPEEYAEVFDDYISGTLGAGWVTVRVRTRHGARYTCTRSYGSEPVIRGENGEVASVSLDGDLFQIDAYAQNEIEGIAKSPSAQLALIDKFAEAEIRRIDDALAQIDGRLRENAAVRRRLEGEIADDAAREDELPSVIEALKGVDLGGDADPRGPSQDRTRAHEAKVQRGRERAAMAALASELESARVALDAFTRDALKKLSRAVEGDLERGGHAEIFRRAHAAMQRVAGAVEGSSGRLRAEIGSVERTVGEEGRALAAAHAKEDEAYQALVLRDDADRQHAAESERLHRRFAELSAVAKRLGDRRREHGSARDEGQALLAEQTRLLQEKSARRKAVAKELSEALEGEVEVTVAAGADSEPFAKLLADILCGANLRAVFVKTIAQRIPPTVLAALAERNEVAPIMEIDPVKSGKEERAAKVLMALRASGRLHELETARLEDLPLIRLRVGNSWRPSNRLSPGQRTSCVLPILLLQSAAPLLIDQAEDNLDNAFIYAVLVKRMAQVKESRQLLVVTHNPNPVVLAFADRIFVLAVEDDGHGEVEAAGTFEQVKPHVERLLEGGRDAFLKRGERYGHYAREEGEDEDDGNGDER